MIWFYEKLILVNKKEIHPILLFIDLRRATASVLLSAISWPVKFHVNQGRISPYNIDTILHRLRGIEYLI